MSAAACWACCASPSSGCGPRARGRGPGAVAHCTQGPAAAGRRGPASAAWCGPAVAAHAWPMAGQRRPPPPRARIRCPAVSQRFCSSPLLSSLQALSQDEAFLAEDAAEDAAEAREREAAAAERARAAAAQRPQPLDQGGGEAGRERAGRARRWRLAAVDGRWAPARSACCSCRHRSCSLGAASHATHTGCLPRLQACTFTSALSSGPSGRQPKCRRRSSSRSRWPRRRQQRPQRQQQTASREGAARSPAPAHASAIWVA